MAVLEEVKKHYGKLKFFLNGQWVDSQSNEVFLDSNPAKDEVIAEVPVATTDEVDYAVTSAYNAFKTWKDVPFRDRAKMIFDLRDTFRKNSDELARILSQDHGCNISDARGTCDRCVENIEAAASSMYSVYKGEHVDQLARGIDCYLLWEPVGVFLMVLPGNIPTHSWSSFVPYALACGCTVVIAPSWQNPVASESVIKVMEQVGFPPGVVNFLHIGKKFELNSRMLSDQRVAGAAFIGSTRIGKEIFELCGKTGKRSSINGNGKNHVVVMPDADIDEAVQYMLRGCFGMTGQRCLGSDNVLIVGDIYDEVKHKFVEASKAMKLGYGLDPAVEMGPLTVREGKEKVEAFIEKGIREGAKLILDGRNVKAPGYEKGYFVAPTIFENVDPKMEIAKEEAFGPVANLIRVENLEQVIAQINSSRYGHSACIVTNSGKTARKFIRECEVGNVGVNAGIPQPYSFFPLGSKKESFFGAAKSRMDSVKLFLDQKTVTLRWV